MDVEDWDPLGFEGTNGLRILHDDLPKWNPKHEIQINLQIAAQAQSALIAELPLPARMIFGNVVNAQTFSLADSADGLFNRWAIR